MSIVDPETGSQPVLVACQTRSLMVALNGEIYNYKDLRKELREQHHFRGGSDTEVLAHLFEERGIECLRLLNGMFALCVSDGVTTYLIRDRFGVKPLYYRLEAGTLLFASEARSLITPPTSLVLEPTYPSFETTLGFQTPFAEVREIPPGHYLFFDSRAGEMSLRRYYSLDNFPVEPMEEHQACEAFRALVEDAVRIRTDTQLPYGCYVSGGLDSSIVAALSRPHILLSAVVTEREYMDERRYLEALCRHLNLESVVVRPDPETFTRDLVDLVHTLDFPVTTLAAFTQYLLSKEAASQGLRVVLGGLGVDEYLGGYARHAAMVGRDEPGTLESQFSGYRPLFAKLERGGRSEGALYYELTNRAPWCSDEALRAVERHFHVQRTPLNRMAAADMSITFPPLLRADDRINMRFSVESRSPFLDYRVIEFGYRLPDALKVRKSQDGALVTKYLLRRAFHDLVPEEISARKDKIGFPSPVALWLSGPLRPLVARAREVISHVRELSGWLLEEPHGEGVEFSRTSWQLVQWAAWYLLFVRGLSPSEATEALFDAKNHQSLRISA